MAFHTYDDECEGCKPVILNPRTGSQLPPSHPAMKAILQAWNQLTFAERQAFHRFTCLNSDAAADILMIESIRDKFDAALQKL